MSTDKSNVCDKIKEVSENVNKAHDNILTELFFKPTKAKPFNLIEPLKMPDAFGWLQIEGLKKDSLKKESDKPKAKIVDTQKPVGEPNEMIETKSGDRTARLQLDGEGKPVKFSDGNGDEIYKVDGQWRRKNFTKPDGEDLIDFKVDGDRNVSVTYKVQKDDAKPTVNGDPVKREFKSDGTITTDYLDGRVTRATSDGAGQNRTVSVEVNGRPLQTLTYQGNDLVKFVAPDGTTFDRALTGGQPTEPQNWTRTKDGVPTAVGAEGDTAAVKASDDGSVVVRDTNLPVDHYATRYLSTGSNVYSDKLGNARITTTQDGLVISDKSEKNTLQERTFLYASGREIKLSFDDKHKVSAISDSSGEFNIDLKNDEKFSLISNEKGNDTIVIELKDESKQIVDGQGNSKILAECSTENGGKDLEGRLLINQIPAGAEDTLFKQVLETSEWKVSVADDFKAWSYLPIVRSDWSAVNLIVGSANFGVPDTIRLGLLKNATADGGRFDIKQKGGEFQEYGNFQWGVYAASMNIPYDFAIRSCGIYKNGENKSPDNSGTISDMTDNKPGVWPYGQNRADASTIKAGYEYYRQHLQAKVEAAKN